MLRFLRVSIISNTCKLFYTRSYLDSLSESVLWKTKMLTSTMTPRRNHLVVAVAGLPRHEFLEFPPTPEESRGYRSRLQSIISQDIEVASVHY
ncbi:hypothetical protein L2E82_08594 [Cichorium intybus]|uniref:Uncharacterized protein n=1 Tax=Cichorium intybus TaxID=13427 RepID=A0ACB9G7C4_CICIN|nr:hypothetical protein L2E82_08594 [Cichorium intybus]